MDKTALFNSKIRFFEEANQSLGSNLKNYQKIPNHSMACIECYKHTTLKECSDFAKLQRQVWPYKTGNYIKNGIIRESANGGYYSCKDMMYD